MNIDKFKPNLIPNNPKDGSFDRDAKIIQNGGYSKYLITLKKDGCRLQLKEGGILTRSLKSPKSDKVVERFQKLADVCKELNIAVDGEFYSHGMKFNQIYRFFSKKDVTCPKYREKLEKELEKNEVKKGKDRDGNSITVTFEEEYETTDIEFLTTFHEDLEFWLFDGIVLDRPDLVRYTDRISEIMIRLLTHESFEELPLELPNFIPINNAEELESSFQNALNSGWEGFVLTHEDHAYKFGRNSLNQGTILKMKNDALEYDGIILEVMEGTQIKDGIARSENELGRSVTSKKKGDREASGIAKGFLVQFEDKGTFTVGLRGFSHEMRRELLENAEKYVGRHFKYTAMEPTKDFPRHSYFDCWRDEK